MKFTEAQRQAIERNGNLIVSAAAGAGKTSVLSERVFRLVSEGMTVDRMLILTFTRAAAGEMKARITKRLLKAAAEDGARAAYYREQAAQVPNANISTIDAFCSKIVFRHYFRVGLTPSCKTLDETETEVLRGETRGAVLDRFAGERAEAYRTLITAFSDEPALIEAMQNAERFLSAQPDPQAWLLNAEAALEDPQALARQLTITLDTDKAMLERHLLELDRQAALLPPACDKVLSLVSELLVHGRGARMQTDRETYGAALRGMLAVSGNLSWPKDFSAEDKKGVTDAKSDLLKLAKEQADRCDVPFDEWMRRERDAAPVLSAFYAIMHAYLDAFAEAKRAQNALDFSDLEHMAIEILKDDEIAAEYRARFSAVIVDEYQDSNRVQEAILNRIAPENAFFFVGDVKQSIYRFRMAEPELFLEKCRDFHGEAGTRIDLGHNFRSGKAVIDAVNTVFATIMQPAIAGIAYDERAMLRQGADVPDGRAELHLFSRETDPDDGESLEDAEAEARFAAQTILNRMREPITDGGAPRACRYDDFAVLLRSKKHARVWTQTLAAAGIPSYAQTEGGYFDAIEVKLVMSLLRVLDNRRQDIPLLAVLRSPFFGFSDADLIRIRQTDRRAPLLDCLLAARNTDAQVDAFFAKLEAWQALSRRLSLGDLLEYLLDETHLREQVGVLVGGDQRTANLDALVAEAQSFDAAGHSGIHGFLRFMDNVKETKQPGAAATVTANVVRIMTIHASKGLEFPFVFLGALGSRFNRQDETKPLVTDARLGVGLRYADRFGVRHETAARTNVIRAIADASWAEELRVLYVGMTRAKQELYLLGSLSNAEKRLAELPQPTPLSIRKSADALRLLLLSLNGHLPFVLHKKSEFSEAKNPIPTGGIPQPTEAERDALNRRFAWRYPFPVQDTLPEKTSVTALERADEPAFDEPAFETGYDVLAAGSAVHRVLERMPLGDAAAWEAYLDSETELSAFHRKAIRRFLSSPLFARMAAAKRVEREWSFVCPFPARELTAVDSDEPVLLQGVIDACFVEDGAWVLLDYKTDRVDGDPAGYAQKHAKQVGLYARVLERLTGMRVREQYIVLLGADAEVRV
ncbi:MAG: UvrD-helicase domain-containing protein [Clostridia bacterium]|nr:UvrD-helicase domain-containing protein [Clostridia bacterium]